MPRLICQDHWENHGQRRPATVNHDGRHLCADCAANASEQAHEEFLAQFYGGSYGPDEAKIDRELRDAGRRW